MGHAMSLRFTRLTRLAIRRLKPNKKLTEHGITAERLANSDTRYSVNVMVDGQRIHRVIGKESDGTTRTQCEEFIEQSRSAARAQRLSLPKGRKLPLSFDKGAGAYITRLEQSDGRNLKAKRGHLRRHLRPFFGAKPLSAITTFDFERYRKQRRSERAAPASINRELASLSHLFTKALEWGWIDRIPARPGQLPEGDGRIVALTDEEADRLRRAAIGSGDPDCWLFVAIGFGTSMRHQEILCMRWEYLDIARRRLFIPQAKAGAREQPLTSELADILAQEREMRTDREGWVFPSRYRNSRTGHRESMDRAFRDAVIRAGLDPCLVTPHVMRHSVLTKLAQANVDIPTIQKISGHKSVKMVLRYIHVHDPHIDQAISVLDRAGQQADVTKPTTPAPQSPADILPPPPGWLPEAWEKWPAEWRRAALDYEDMMAGATGLSEAERERATLHWIIENGGMTTPELHTAPPERPPEAPQRTRKLA
jgi:integrase